MRSQRSSTESDDDTVTPGSSLARMVLLLLLALVPCTGWAQSIFSYVTEGPLVEDFEGSMGAVWVDYDDDNYLDVFVVNSVLNAQPQPLTTNSLYRNNGDRTFTKITNAVTTEPGRGFSGSWGDYDNDGFLDLFVACGRATLAPNRLYHNDSKALGNVNHWLRVKLRGTESNAYGIGAKVRVQATLGAKTVWQVREITSENAWSGDNGLQAHFGLGEATTAHVRVEWPSGMVQELTCSSDQILAIVEPPRPELAIGVSGDQVTVSWDTTHWPLGSSTPWYLEQASNLSMPDWQTLPDSPQTNRFTFPAEAATRFFRLSQF